MAPQADPEIRRALLEEARDRLRTVRRRDRSEAILAVHSLAASVAAAGPAMVEMTQIAARRRRYEAPDRNQRA